MVQVLLAGVPFTDILDAAVVESVLTAGRRVQVHQHVQAELRGPAQGTVQDLDAALDEGVRVGAVAGVIRIRRTENPVAHGNAHGVDARLGQPGEILTCDESFPVGPQTRRGVAAKRCAPGGLIGCRESGKKARRHPLLQQEPSAEVHPAKMGKWC